MDLRTVSAGVLAAALALSVVGAGSAGVGAGSAGAGSGTIGLAAVHKVSDTEGSFQGTLANFDRFGEAVAALGDLDGDGRQELAVGAPGADDGGNERGALWILSRLADGTVVGERRIAAADVLGATGLDGSTFGAAVAALGDLDGDGTSDLAVGAPTNGASAEGAVLILFLNPDGSVRTARRIGAGDGGFTGALSASDAFGGSLAALGDLGGDGTLELAVGAYFDDDPAAGGLADRGAVWILSLDDTGLVQAQTKISASSGGFAGALAPGDFFGIAVAALGDLDGDGGGDLAVGSHGRDLGGLDRGAVSVLFLDAGGGVAKHVELGQGAGGFGGTLADLDAFGGGLAFLGRVGGAPLLAVGAQGDSNGRGAVWLVGLEPTGAARDATRLGADAFPPNALDPHDRLGRGLAALGDPCGSSGPGGPGGEEGDGGVGSHACDVALAAGAPLDDDGGSSRGAVWTLFLDVARTSTPFCFGDGSGTACPCGNAGAPGTGCAHPAGGGVRLSDADFDPEGGPGGGGSVTFVGEGFRPDRTPTALVLRSVLRENGGLGTPFGDGLLCVAAPMVRLKPGRAVGGTVSIATTHRAGPGELHYQLWYRSEGEFCRPERFNLSNGLTLAWP